MRRHMAAFIGTLAVVLIKLPTVPWLMRASVAMAVGAFHVQRFGKVDTVWIVLGGVLVSLLVLR